MSALQSLVCFRGVLQTEDFGDRNIEARLHDRAVEALELARARLGVVRGDANAAPLPRLGLDAIRVRHASARAKGVHATRQLLAADECQHRVDSVGCEL